VGHQGKSTWLSTYSHLTWALWHPDLPCWNVPVTTASWGATLCPQASTSVAGVESHGISCPGPQGVIWCVRCHRTLNKAVQRGKLVPYLFGSTSSHLIAICRKKPSADSYFYQLVWHWIIGCFKFHRELQVPQAVLRGWHPSQLRKFTASYRWTVLSCYFWPILQASLPGSRAFCAFTAGSALAHLWPVVGLTDSPSLTSIRCYHEPLLIQYCFFWGDSLWPGL
jgi:hypothetical protein